MKAITSFARRLRRHRRALGFNPLIRVSDRLEALAVLAVFATAFFAIPTAAQVASQIYDSGRQTAAEQAQSRRAVEAVAVDGSSSLPADFDGTDYVRVQWHEGTELRTERVLSPVTVKAGEPMTIWLDQADKVVAAPMTTGDAKVSALGVALTIWVVLVTCSALVAFLIRQGLNRSRERAWDRELLLMAHNDDGWANRHT